MRLVCVMVGLGLSGVAAATPGTMTHSGRLLDASGTPLNGQQAVTLTVYSGADAGATALWTDTSTVDLDGGYYTVVLGDDPPFADGVWDGSVRWLGIAVGGVSTGARQPIYSVPYAERASVAERALVADSATIADSATTATTADTAINATGDITPSSVTTGGTVRADSVGVGVPASAGRIEVQTDSIPGVVIRSTNTNDSSAALVLDGPAGTERALSIQTDGSQEWWFGRDNSGAIATGIGLWREGEGFALIVDDQRDVGIGGVVDPQAALDVSGGVRTSNMGKLEVVNGWAGTVESIPFTAEYVLEHVGETYTYAGFGPRFADDSACAGAGTNGLPRAFFDGDNSSAMGQYSFTLYSYGTLAGIVGTWQGWRAHLRSPTNSQVAEGVGEVNFTLRHSGTRWEVQHMAGQVGGVSWSCR